MNKRYLGLLSSCALLLGACNPSSNSSSTYQPWKTTSSEDDSSNNGNSSTTSSIEDHDHVLTYVAAKDATCGEDGNIAYYVCSVCGQYFSDEEGEHQIDASSVVIPATGEHTWDDNVCTVCGYDAGGTKGLNWTESNDSYTVSGLGSASGDIEIPSTYNGLPVTGVGISTDDYSEGAFYSSDITSITIPEGVTSIGDYAFAYCYNLESVSLPSTVTDIGAYAFCYAYHADFDIKGSIKNLGNYSFYYCQYLSSISLGEGLTSIPKYCFAYCYDLESITIPNSVTAIDDYAFRYCSSLKSITIPDKVTSIGNYAFYYCTALTSASIGNGVTSIGDYAFYDCYSLTSLTLPENNASIGTYAFGYCSSLQSVVIPNSITSIGDKAFYSCDSLLSVTIGSGVTSIGDYAFRYCYKLVEVYNLSSLSISKSSTNNGYAGYYALDIYTSLDYESKLTTTGSGFIFYESGDTVYVVAYVGSSNELNLPSTYNSKNYSIYKYAFYDMTNLTSVSFGSGITSIGDYAFSGCRNITSLVIPSNITTIGGSAFYTCYGLISATIGSGVTSIGNSAFYGCYKLVEVYNLSSLTITAEKNANGYAGYYAKDIYTSTSEASKLVYTDDGYIFYENGDSVFLLGYKGTSTELSLPSNCNSKTYKIYPYAFYYQTDIKSVTISSGATYIYHDAFRYCQGLTSLSIGDDVSAIEDHAFANCSILKSVYIGSSVSSITSKSFYSTYKIESLEVSSSNSTYRSNNNCLIETSSKTLVKGCNNSSIPNDGSVTIIGKYAFYGCSDLFTVTLPSALTSIEGYAFSSCSKLTSIVIPSSVTSIGTYAFSSCSKLSSATFENTSGWYVTKTANATSGDSVTVTNSSDNATYLTNTYKTYYWYRS